MIRYELAALRDITGLLDLSPSLWDQDGASGGELLQGPRKLAQTWTLLFLQEEGSMPLLEEERGTGFIAAARRGALRNTPAIQAEFGFAALRVATQLQLAYRDDTPDDERLRRAELTRAIIDSDGLVLEVSLYTVAGDVVPVALPLPVSILSPR